MEVGREARLIELARRQHGVFSLAQWTGHGLSPASLTRRVRGGLVTRMAPQVYAYASVPPTWHMEVAVAVLASGRRAAASHRTAAHIHGLAGRPDRIEVVTLRTGRRPSGYTLHQSTDLARSHITKVNGISTTTIARTIVDIGVPHGIGRTGSCLDEARRRELVSLEDVAFVLHQVARRGRNGVGPARKILVERLAWDQITESQLEDRFLHLLQGYELPVPRCQHPIYDAQGGLVARVDFAYPESGLLIELDGAQFHTDRRSFQLDRVRQNRLIAQGYRVLRFTYWDVMAAPEYVIDTIDSFLPRNWEREARI